MSEILERPKCINISCFVVESLISSRRMATSGRAPQLHPTRPTFFPSSCFSLPFSLLLSILLLSSLLICSIDAKLTVTSGPPEVQGLSFQCALLSLSSPRLLHVFFLSPVPSFSRPLLLSRCPLHGLAQGDRTTRSLGNHREYHGKDCHRSPSSFSSSWSISFTSTLFLSCLLFSFSLSSYPLLYHCVDCRVPNTLAR